MKYMKEDINIDLVFMPTEEKTYWELNLPLYAAFKEVEKFYNFGKERANFRFLLLSEDAIRESHEKSAPSKLWNFIFGSKHSEEKEANSFSSATRISLEKSTNEHLKEVRGRFSRTYDSEKIIKLVENTIGEDEIRARAVIVIDKELTPPSQWRYVIWFNRVISTLPIDPLYWGHQNTLRIAVIKHRVRTACLQVVGQLLGIGRCLNETCFMYRNVDSVVRLDKMLRFGDEHSSLCELANYGFDPKTSNPGETQPVVKIDLPRGELS